MNEVLLFGEPMALLTAESTGPLEEVEYFKRSLSGAEVNVCIGLTRLDHKVTYITRLGDDPFGHYIYKFLQKESIDTEFITYDSIYKTGIQLKSKVIRGDPHAPYYRVYSAASRISAKEIDAINLDGIKLVHLTGIPPALSLSCREAAFRLIKRAKENHIFVSFDPNLRPVLWENKDIMVETINKIASECNLILPGVEEGLQLTGSNDPDRIADFYRKLGVETVVIKLGADGAYVRDREETYLVPGFKVEKVIDTVGAGDGFAVGVLDGILNGLPLKESVLQGNAIGSIQVMNESDNEGLPTKIMLKEYLKQKSK